MVVEVNFQAGFACARAGFAMRFHEIPLSGTNRGRHRPSSIASKKSPSARCGLAFQETIAKNLRTFVGRFSFDLSASLSLPSFSWLSPSWALSLRISWLTSCLSNRPCSSARPSRRPTLRPAGLSSSQASALPLVLPVGCPSQAPGLPLVLPAGCPSQAPGLPLVLPAGCPWQHRSLVR